MMTPRAKGWLFALIASLSLWALLFATAGEVFALHHDHELAEAATVKSTQA
jgi:hypothetical protein